MSLDRRPWWAAPTAALLLLLCLAVSSAVASPGPPAGSSVTSELPARTVANEPGTVDPHDPTTPVGAVRDFIDACRADDYATAAERLNLSGIPADQRATRGEQLARWFKVVLDRELWIQYETMSDRPEGRLDDGLKPDLERVDGQGDLDVLLQRVQRDGRQVWVFSAGTVARIPELYERYGYGPLGEILPRTMFERQFLEVRLWQWLGLSLLLVFGWLGAWISVSLITLALRPVVRRTKTELDDELLGLIRGPSQLGIALALFAAGSVMLRLSVPAYDFLGKLERGVAVVALSWALLRLVDIVGALVAERLEKDHLATAKAIVPLARRTVKVCLVALAAVFLLQNLGFQVAGLLAGLGVGGLAVALAAQKTLANLFGGVTLILDHPVRVGDFCRFGDGKLGTVEEVGLRSTRVRTLDRTVVTVPNSEFSEIQLENFALRDRIRLVMTIGLRYETTPDQMRYVLKGLREVLLSHPRVSNEPARVRFSGFGSSSLNVDVFAYVETSDYNEFCALQEDILLRFMDVVTDAGTGFAFPSQTLYLGRDGGLDGERSAEAVRRVGEWRERGELPFPDFDPDYVARIDGQGDYPPTGSATVRGEGES